MKYNAVDANVYRSFGFPGADEMGNMFQVYRDFEKQFIANRNLDVARKLNPALQNFDQLVEKNKDKILAAANPAPAARRRRPAAGPLGPKAARTSQRTAGRYRRPFARTWPRVCDPPHWGLAKRFRRASISSI